MTRFLPSLGNDMVYIRSQVSVTALDCSIPHLLNKYLRELFNFGAWHKFILPRNSV